MSIRIQEESRVKNGQIVVKNSTQELLNRIIKKEVSPCLLTWKVCQPVHMSFLEREAFTYYGDGVIAIWLRIYFSVASEKDQGVLMETTKTIFFFFFEMKFANRMLPFINVPPIDVWADGLIGQKVVSPTWMGLLHIGLRLLCEKYFNYFWIPYTVKPTKIILSRPGLLIYP